MNLSSSAKKNTRPHHQKQKESGERWLLCEMYPFGHRLRHVQMIADHLNSEGHLVLVAVPEVWISTREWQIHVQPLTESGRATYTTPESLPCSKHVGIWRWIRSVIKTARRHQVDNVVLFMADRLALPWLVMRALTSHSQALHCTMVLLPSADLNFMRGPGWSRQLRAAVRDLFLLVAVKAGCVQRVVMLQGVLEGGQKYHSPVKALTGRLVQWVRDPFDSMDICVSAKPKRAVILSIGDISRRRGLSEILSCWRTLSQDPSWRIPLRLVGRVKDCDRDLLLDTSVARLEAHGLLELKDEYVSNEVFATELANATAVLLVYRDYDAPSGVLAQALAAATPVITAGNAFVAREVKELRCGFVTEATAPQLACAVRRIVSTPKDLVLPGLIDSNSVHFCRAVTDVPGA